MAAYVIVEVTIENAEEYEAYKKLTPASIAAYGGRFAARGGKTVTLEGNWQPERIVILEFPNINKANEWWHSEEYKPAKEIRQRSARTKMIVVEGV